MANWTLWALVNSMYTYGVIELPSTIPLILTEGQSSKSMDIIISSPRGFCAGVVRAIEIVELCIEHYGAPIYVRHEIVHNPFVVKTLRDKGAVFITHLSDVPKGALLVYSAHGVPPEVKREARKRKLQVIDATCPLVTKVHLEALKYARDNYSIILVGHQGHDEVIGTMGEAPDRTWLVATVEDAQRVNVQTPERVVALTQTTLSMDDTRAIISVLAARFPSLITRNDICYATSNRQLAVKALAAQVDLILVIGAQNSSNCNRLREVAMNHGVRAYLINGATEIDPQWLQGVSRVGITSGASTPENLVQSVVEYLKPEQVKELEIIKEDVYFPLPKQIRNKVTSQ